ncbi:MAG: ClpXP protease specificity-enhancing factor SspB [Pseudomonadota bacterium]
MPESVIDYDRLAQEALRSVVRTVLQRVEQEGLPGEHHFYIAFDTRTEGVALSKRLREQYPEEMTIVLQHRFWGLIVSSERFEVKLTFNNVPERLVVPYAAIKVFFDPSVPYGLQFEPSHLMSEAQTTAQPPMPALLKLDDGRRPESEGGQLTALPRAPTLEIPPRPSADRAAAASEEANDERDSDADGSGRESADIEPFANNVATFGGRSSTASNENITQSGQDSAGGNASDAAVDDVLTSDGEAQDQSEPDGDDEAPKTAQVVSLDSFRKK